MDRQRVQGKINWFCFYTLYSLRVFFLLLSILGIVSSVLVRNQNRNKPGDAEIAVCQMRGEGVTRTLLFFCF